MAMALLVEDNPINRKLMRDILEMGFDVTEAESAEDAAVYLESQKPDLIFMDMLLPGMDGLTFIRQLKADESTRDIPIVAISAHAMQHDIKAALDSGCAEYVTKPFVEDPIEFVERMKTLLQPL